MPKASAIALLVTTFALAGCADPAGDVETTIPGIIGDADPAAVEVIDAWSTALREGDVDGAAELFALPSEAQNGPARIEITERADAVTFNRSLPCGAELERAVDHAGFVIATFRLTERPGEGRCGAGTGELARTAFRIADGEIVEWLRVPSPDDVPAPGGVV